MDTEKKYCIECKYCVVGNCIASMRCNNEHNYKEEWFSVRTNKEKKNYKDIIESWTFSREYKYCEEVNKNNNCKWYEKIL